MSAPASAEVLLLLRRELSAALFDDDDALKRRRADHPGVRPGSPPQVQSPRQADVTLLVDTQWDSGMQVADLIALSSGSARRRWLQLLDGESLRAASPTAPPLATARRQFQHVLSRCLRPTAENAVV